MKKKLFGLILFLIAVFSTNAQIITFDDQGHSPGQILPNPYTITNSGETFLFTISGGVSTNHIYRTTEGSCGSTGMSHIYAGNFTQTTWTIETMSGNQIDLGTIRFDNVFSCFSGFSYSLNIEGFKDNTSTGMQTFTVSGLNTIYTSNSSFDDVDKIVITSSDLAHLGIDNIDWAVALPVELVSFTAKKEWNNLTLSWSTATEFNNEKFQIESSTNGQEFETIGELKGKGTSSSLQDYSFNIENPKRGITYYRLKQIDFDGQFEYSKIIIVNYKEKNDLIGEFYPNPSRSGLVNLNYTFRDDEEIAISVFDLTGKLVAHQIYQVPNGNNNLDLDFSNMDTGIYIIKIGDEINPTYRKLILER